MSNGKIFVIYHKPSEEISSEIYTPIIVGDRKDEFPSSFLRDDLGDNIANKNSYYNELTAIYWVYKHIDEFNDISYIGFSHYRRLFAFNGLDKTSYVRKRVDKKLIEIDNEKLDRLFKDYDLIVPRTNHYSSVKKHYKKSHNDVDIDILTKAIGKVEPSYNKDTNEYLDSQDEYLYNMFIFKKDDFIKYAEFIFKVIDEYLKLKNDVSRLYISERLTGIYIYHLISKGNRALHLPIMHIRDKSTHSSHSEGGFIYKHMPVFLYIMPRCVEQYYRRRKAR